MVAMIKNDVQGNVIGLLAEPNPPLLVGILGVLKSGHGFLPLDPKSPVERLRYALADCGVRILAVTAEHLEKAVLVAGGLDALTDIICLDAAPAAASAGRVRIHTLAGLAAAADADAAAENRARADGLAYVIYTSGSTGAPKGVPITHRNVVPLLLWSRDYFGLGEQTRVLQNLAPWFDFGVFELLTTMLFGGTLYFPGRATQDMLSGYADFIARHSLDTIHSTPSFFQRVTASRARLETLRIVHLGGEQLTRRALDEVFAAVGEDCAVYNGYGPTEASVNCSIYNAGTPAAPALPAEAAGDSIPIGHATANNTLYVLDRHMSLVPAGVPGELYVGGAGLSHGYLNRPGLTAERFVPDSFSGNPGARLYRTGDLVRRLHPDGRIEFLGRLDFQVKIRGFRVEPGEIEAALAAHPRVRHCAVLAPEERGGGRRLVAYVAGDDGGAPAASELREFLRARLPAYMVPSEFIAVEEMPLNANGKVDRKALPAPDPSARETQADFVAPRTPAEEVVAGICAEVLGLERIGVHDDLFDLGCHSLLATKILARVREALRADMPLASIFESPTAAGLAALAEAAGQSGETPTLPPIEPVERGGQYPLSFVQEGIWFLDQLYAGNTSYFIPRAMRIRGDFSVPAVAAAFEEVVRRHEILRTVFPSVDGKPVQIILPPAPVEVPLTDLQGIPEEEREERAMQLIVEAGRQPFDLERGPLLRVGVLRLDAREHILVLVEHHLVHDGWTQGILLREVLELYAAISEGKPSPLPELPIQYVDFAVWQRRWLQGEALRKQLDYWKRQLAGPPPPLKIETDRPRPPVQSLSGAELTIEIPAELADALRALSRRRGVTLFMTMLAAYQALLQRYTAQEEVSVGTPIANRRCQEVEGMLGMIVNMVVIRTDLSGEPTFDELLERVRDVCLEAYAHQDVPFEMIVQALQPKRDLSFTPFFQTVFGFLDTPMGNIELPGLELELLDAHNRSAKFDLNVVLVLHEEQRIGVTSQSDNRGITALFEYNTDIFDAATVERLMGHYLQLLESVVADSSQRLSELRILPPDEERRLLYGLNETGPAQPPPPVPVQELVARHARTRPEATAVLCGGQSLTYSELDRRAERLARLLRRRGCRGEAVVGVCLERSAAWVVAMLAVLKAGGAYLPLNPNEPGERQRLMLEDAGARLVLTTAELRGRLGLSDEAAVCLDAEGQAVPGTLTYGNNGGPEHGDESHAASFDLRQTAYVIYTSGSTGRPKGVMVEHVTLLNLIAWHLRRFGVSAGERVTQVASPAFDASVFEVWPALAAGACLCIAGAEERTDAGRMWRWLREVGAAVSYMPTPLAEAVLAVAEAEAAESEPKGAEGRGWPPALRALLTAGDRLRRWNVPGAPFELFNLYGPTEATVASTEALTPARDASGGAASPSIGRAIDGVQVYALDAHMRPVPAGVAGELYVGGANVGRGYLGRPALTAERFLPDPFGGAPGGRLYRTGDVVRWNNRGELEFLGRADEQVKVRGFRVEPGEIEVALHAHASVREAVVVAAEDAHAGTRLVAYVVPRQAEAGPVPADELRAHLKQRLPEHMIPSAFVVLDELPLTPNGKVDRRRLPAPELPGADTTEGDAPATPTEEVVAGIWADALGLERVGRDADFFELGGHSLLATEIVSRLRELFRVELPIRSLFESPTVATLAAAITRESGRRRGVQAPPVRPVARGVEMPLSYAQQRLWFLNQLEPDSPFYSLPVAVRLRGRLDADVLERVVNEVIRRHEVLRTNFVRVGSQPVQVIAPSRTLTLTRVDLRELSAPLRDERLRRLAVEETHRPFDLTSDLLVRVTLFRLEEDDHVALLNMHHIISDGWSLAVLVQEVSLLYAAFTEGRESPLAELPVQYADFAAWQHEWLQGEVLDAQLAYWERQLDGLPALELRTDFPRPAAQSFRGARLDFSLPADATAALKALGRQEGATLYMTLLAAFQVLLQRYSGQQDFAVGVNVANRNRREIEGLIGFFINMLAVRADLSGDPTFRELLGRVRETALDAHAHADVPFDKVVERLRPTRDPSRNPLFQVVLALQNTRPMVMELPGVQLTPFDLELHTSKFDLLLALLEEDGALNGYAHYDTALFSAATVARMLEHLSNILDAVAADPDRRVSAIRLLSEDETAGLAAEDFPDAGLDQQEFESLAMEINKLSEVN